MGPFQRLRSMNTILVVNTSSVSDENSVAADLAKKCVQKGEKVLLIDSNLRHPTLHKVFGLKNDLGLSNILYKSYAPHAIIKPSEIKNLFILTTGSHPVNIFDSFNSDKLKCLLAVLRQNFDKIIIQGPPFFFQEALSLAALVDSVLILIHPGFNSNDISQKIIDRFQLTGAQITGIALRNQLNFQLTQTSTIGNLLTFDHPLSQFP